MFRIEPNLPVHAYKTYVISAPLASHWRKATCQEVTCEQYQLGWKIVADLKTDMGQRQALLISRSGRKFTEERVPGELTEYVFEPGQQCFNEHRTRLDKPERFIERGGDWRGNPREERRVHVNPDNWVESFAEHQDKLHTAIERG